MEKTKTRRKLRKALNGGQECEGSSSKTETCDPNHCPGNDTYHILHGLLWLRVDNFFKKYLKGYQLFQNANGMNGVTGHPVVEVAGMEEHNFAEGVNLQKRVTRNVIALEILERKEIAHYCIAAKRI